MLWRIFVILHRWVGLTIAAFLFVSGLTGAVISWDHEFAELINPHLVEAPVVQRGPRPLPRPAGPGREAGGGRAPILRHLCAAASRGRPQPALGGRAALQPGDPGPLRDRLQPRLLRSGDRPGGEHDPGLGSDILYFDSADGRYIGDWIPWRGTAGDLFIQMQFPVHSGRIFSIPGRILISAMGLGVAMLSLTGRGDLAPEAARPPGPAPAVRRDT